MLNKKYLPSDCAVNYSVIPFPKTRRKLAEKIILNKMREILPDIRKFSLCVKKINHSGIVFYTKKELPKDKKYFSKELILARKVKGKIKKALLVENDFSVLIAEEKSLKNIHIEKTTCENISCLNEFLVKNFPDKKNIIYAEENVFAELNKKNIFKDSLKILPSKKLYALSAVKKSVLFTGKDKSEKKERALFFLVLFLLTAAHVFYKFNENKTVNTETQILEVSEKSAGENFTTENEISIAEVFHHLSSFDCNIKVKKIILENSFLHLEGEFTAKGECKSPIEFYNRLIEIPAFKFLELKSILPLEKNGGQIFIIEGEIFTTDENK